MTEPKKPTTRSMVVIGTDVDMTVIEDLEIAAKVAAEDGPSYRKLSDLDIDLSDPDTDRIYKILMETIFDPQYHKGRIVGDARYGLVDKAVKEYYETEHDIDIMKFDEDKQPYSDKIKKVPGVQQAGSQGLSRIYHAILDTPVPETAVVKASLNGQPYQILSEGRVQKEISELFDGAPKVYDYNVLMLNDGSVFSVTCMEYIDGPGLDAFLADPEKTLVDKLKAIRDVAKKVDEFHGLTGYVHRDLKPSNVKMSSNGVRIIDFPTVTRIGQKPKSEEVLGTAHYMAPEHLHNKADVRMDLYSICCILYETITGKVPNEQAINSANRNTPKYLEELSKAMYDSMQKEKYFKDIPEETRKKLESVNENLYQVVVENLRFDPDKRMHRDCLEFANALDYVINDMETVLSARVNADQLAIESYEQGTVTRVSKARRTIDPAYYARTTPEEAEIAKSGIGYLVTDNTLPVRGSEADQIVYPRPPVGKWTKSQ